MHAKFFAKATAVLPNVASQKWRVKSGESKGGSSGGLFTEIRALPGVNRGSSFLIGQHVRELDV